MGLRTAGGQMGWGAAVQISSFSHSLAPKVCLSTFDTGEENEGNTLWLLQFILHVGPLTLVCVVL